MVHIDLGIAFDQGKLLTVPEQVPFRMTSDVVDGMGAAGTQGVFQRCAEETLRVLREGSEVIMTVLEVFKHDPLHSWTASEIKLKNVQKDADGAGGGLGRFRTGLGGIGIDMASGTADEAADRALTGVARKLDKAMSVEYTVNELIAEATDPMRLATIWWGECWFFLRVYQPILTRSIRLGRHLLASHFIYFACVHEQPRLGGIPHA
jgi:ataxia telangiectasia mutated family protein